MLLTMEKPKKFQQTMEFITMGDRISTKKETCLTPTLMDEDKPETLIQPTMGIKWNSGSLP